MPRRAAAAATTDPIPDSNAVEIPQLQVPLASLYESPLNPRKRHDEASLAELAASIRQYGIIAPIVVREAAWHVAGQAMEFEIIAGSRRFRAATIAGLSLVPVIVRAVTDAQLLELALQENTQRASMSPLEEGRALDKLAELDPIYRDEKILAAKIGRSETYVRDRRKLLRLDDTVIRALEGEAITAKHAERIARLPRDQHAAALRACFAQLFISDAEYVALLDNGAWDRLAPQLVGLREFDRWAERHATVDVTAPDAQRELAPALEELFTSEHVDDEDLDASRQAATAEMLRLSEDVDYQFTKKDAKALAVIRAGDWKEITRDKDGCDFEFRGIVVHGGPMRVAERVCVDKRHCTKHWPKPTVAKADTNRAARDAADHEREKRKREKADAERAQWEAAAPAFAKAFGQLVARQKYAPIAIARAVLSRHDLERFRETFGLQLTDQTALALLFIQRQNVGTYSPDHFFTSAATLGITRKQIEAAAAYKPAAAMALDAPAPKFQDKVEATVWRVLLSYERGEEEFRRVVRKGIDDKALDDLVRARLGTGGYLGDDGEWETRSGELSIRKPVKVTLSTAQVRAIVRRLALAPGHIEAVAAMASKKPATKKGGKKR
jgi:ParB/RepB/Spo0J family partition protein